MGGENEKPLRTKSDKAPAPAKSLTVAGGTGRIHEDKGYVHLHEGQTGERAKLKVAVPSHVYHQRVMDWVARGMVEPLVFIDTASGTRCVIRAFDPDEKPASSIAPLSTAQAPQGDQTLDAEITWGVVKFGGNLKNLVDHAEAK